METREKRIKVHSLAFVDRMLAGVKKIAGLSGFVCDFALVESGRFNGINQILDPEYNKTKRIVQDRIVNVKYERDA